MSYIQIPNLPAAVALSGSELLEVVQGGVSVRAALSQVVGFVNFSVAIGSTGIAGGVTGSYLLVGSGGFLAQQTVSQLLASILAALPTTNPHVVGQWWLNGEVVSVSQG